MQFLLMCIPHILNIRVSLKFVQKAPIGLFSSRLPVRQIHNAPKSICFAKRLTEFFLT